MTNNAVCRLESHHDVPFESFFGRAEPFVIKRYLLRWEPGADQKKENQ